MVDKNHIHKFKKHRYKNGTVVYFCTLNCDYKIEAAIAIGKETLCNQCLEPFIMNEYTIKLVRPHCSRCGKTMVKNADGSRSYVDKTRTQVIAKELAANPIQSLKDRMTQVSQVVTMERDEDI